MQTQKINKNIFLVKLKNNIDDFEVVERKGLGHPDTMADALAEKLSIEYSKYTLEHFGAILHHNFDKLGLLGGQSFVSLGKGYMVKPIRVLLNGRASVCFDKEKIPVRKILEDVVYNFLIKQFPVLDKEKDIKIYYNIAAYSSPGTSRFYGVNKEEGNRKYMFRPRGIQDLKELIFLGSNDTSAGCSFAPLTSTEKIVLYTERYLNSSYRKSNPWLGSDIKLMACRFHKNLEITIAVPQIANYVPDLKSYKDNLEQVKVDILKFIEKIDSTLKVNLYIDTISGRKHDDKERDHLYLTAIGSSIESGDEGLVGRGNRINGLITPCRPMVMEASCGKNPVYHAGKLYSITAERISEKLYDLTGSNVEVYVVSQKGRALQDPWKIIVALEKIPKNSKKLTDAILRELDIIPRYKHMLLNGKINLF